MPTVPAARRAPPAIESLGAIRPRSFHKKIIRAHLSPWALLTKIGRIDG